MRVLVAPNAFKGTLTAIEAARHMRRGLLRGRPHLDVDCMPVADGGDGLLDVLLGALGGNRFAVRVTGPLAGTLTARFGIFGDGCTAVVEMARASGLAILRNKKNDVMRATTYGTGELIRAALGRNCRTVIVGIGGSATVDGGAGMAQALGARLLDSCGNEIGPGGGALVELATIDVSGMDERIGKTLFIAACDVTNPLTGPDGAARVFGPQKGASPRQVAALEKNLRNFANVVRRDMGLRLSNARHAGAAGGLGAGLMAFCGAKPRPGTDVVLDAVDFEGRLKHSQLVIVGEGRFDSTTAFGKAPAVVARRARTMGVPVIGIAGSVGRGWEKLRRVGITDCFSLSDGPGGLAESMARPGPAIERLCERIARTIM
jgi:glycerate kinase